MGTHYVVEQTDLDRFRIPGVTVEQVEEALRLLDAVNEVRGRGR